jgi:glycosyltransferase involved in cell wall biosynthesis
MAWLTVFLRQIWVRLFRVPRLCRAAAAFARLQRVEILWVVLNSPTLVHMASRLARDLGIPLVVTVQDPPERWAEESRFDWLSRWILLRRFAEAIHMAERLGTASENMRDEYRRRYGKDSEVLIHGAHPSLRHLPAAVLRHPGELVIGVAGNLYSATEWYALLRALDSVNWIISDRRVRIRVLGPDLVLYRQRCANIEFLGWRPMPEAVALLAETDLAYLPYFFDERFRLTVKLCFPNKLTAYLAAGLPVLFHGPEDSSPARFFGQYPIGACCHTLAPEEIMKCLRRFVDDPVFYRQSAEAGGRALDEELNVDVFLRRFAAMVGVDPALLRPISVPG